MADNKAYYPQLPAAVWWGLKEQFKKSLPNKVTDSYLHSYFGVQTTAAKAYLNELKRIGLVDQEGRPTDLARRWRMDDTYRSAADEILKSAYPEELIDVASPEDRNRESAKRWFMSTAHLGEGAAKNKTATYFLIGSDSQPDEIALKPAKSNSNSNKSKVNVKAIDEKSKKVEGSERVKGKEDIDLQNEKNTKTDMGFPLNVNIQIHISADATSDQIEAIFINMKKYLRD